MEENKVNTFKANTLNESIINIRVKLQSLNLKKSGKNRFQGFEYFELSDFLPSLNKLMLEERVNDLFTIEDGYAQLILIKGEERQTYKIPYKEHETPVNAKNQKVMQDIQYQGALNTYYKRYLYINAFGISDVDEIDSMDSNQLHEVNNKTNNPNATEVYLRQYIKDNKIENEIVINALKEFGYSRLKEINQNEVKEFINKLKRGDK